MNEDQGIKKDRNEPSRKKEITSKNNEQKVRKKERKIRKKERVKIMNRKPDKIKKGTLMYKVRKRE